MIPDKERLARAGEHLTYAHHPEYRRMARLHPAELLTLVKSATLAPHELTWAAEWAGLINDAGAVQDALLPLLSHESAVVREGAIYGLKRHPLTLFIRERLSRLAETDPSIGVRCVAADVLYS